MPELFHARSSQSFAQYGSVHTAHPVAGYYQTVTATLPTFESRQDLRLLWPGCFNWSVDTGNGFRHIVTNRHSKGESTMKHKISHLFTIICALIMLAGANDAPAQTPQLRATNQQLRTLLDRIESKTQTFQNTINLAANNDRNRDEELIGLVQDFSTATYSLQSRVNARQNAVSEVPDMLDKASLINRFIAQNRVTGRTATQWQGLKVDLNTLASYYRMNWNWNENTNSQTGYPAYTATDTQLRSLISRIESKTNTYKQAMDNSLDRSGINNTNSEDSINSYIGRFEDATDRLKNRFSSRQSTVADASEVLNRARFIDQFMARSRMNRNAQNQWSSLRTDLNTLASYYRVSWNWNEQNPAYPVNTFPTSGIDARMTGTYRLNPGRSDNVADVINRSLGNYSNDQRDNIRQNLERRLRSPEMIAIESRGRTVSMASSNSPQVTFEADGIAKSETNDRGRTVTTTATSNNNGVLINYEGDRMNDFYVTFSPSGNGQLNVSRRIYLENRNETVTVSSVYDKVNNRPQWSTVNNDPVSTSSGINDFYVANGMQINATLRELVTTKSSQSGDRFVMDVTSPGQYRGAVIEGKVTQVADSGRFSGRANISLDFETIRMNGRTYRFAGIIESVTAANGDTVSVNNEGTVRDSSQTTQTATRAGIGAVLGAIIGAVAGGGKGAAIGAAVGGGAGAGTVLITGRDSIELGPGSVFNITASAPANVGLNR